MTTPIGAGWDSANALVLQPDGKLVAAGISHSGSDHDVALARYNADGSLDTKLNGTGKVTTAIGAGSDSANALVLQPDGKLVAAGYSYQGSGTNNDAALVRFNPNGSLDTSFNGSGKVTTPIGSARPRSLRAGTAAGRQAARCRPQLERLQLRLRARAVQLERLARHELQRKRKGDDRDGRRQ